MKKITNILFFLALISLMLVTTELYSSYHARAQDSGLLVSNTSSDSEAAAQKFVDQINILANVRLDRTIFSSPIFKSLVDFSQPLPVEDSGKANPFSPI